jgi:hypothetical protein
MALKCGMKEAGLSQILWVREGVDLEESRAKQHKTVGDSAKMHKHSGWQILLLWVLSAMNA